MEVDFTLTYLAVTTNGIIPNNPDFLMLNSNLEINNQPTNSSSNYFKLYINILINIKNFCRIRCS